MRARLWICALSLLIAAPALVRAQAVTGSLEGRILSAPGEPLEHAVVTVSGPFLQGTRSATTDVRGHFLLLWLPAGTYTVRLRALGFGPVAMSDVRVSLGATASLGDVTLEPQAMELPEIVVSGARPLIDPTTAAATTALDSAVFLALPTERNYRLLMPLVPQANASPYGDEVNVAGASGDENGYFVDGIHVTDPFMGAGSLNLPYNFMREVQVTTGAYAAEYGRTQGGVVNVVTNSGGNALHGQVLGFYTGDRLRATPRWGVGQAQVERFSHYDVGASVGGPIRRDRLWYYVAYNPTVESRDAAFPGIETERDARTSHLFAGKLTGRTGRGTDLTLTVLGDPSRRDYVGAAGGGSLLAATVTDPRVVLGRISEGGTAVALQARHQLGDRVFLTWSLARLDRRQDQTPRAGVLTDMVALAQVVDYETNTASGNFGWSQRTRMARTAGQAAVTVLAGSHLLRVGTEYEANVLAFDLRYSLVLRSVDSAGTAEYYWFRNTQHARGHIAVPTLYAQDSWQVSRRLQLNLGLRWEAQFVWGDTGIARWIAPELAPRLGVVFQPGELGVQKVYASAGRFYEQMPLWTTLGWDGLFEQRAGIYPRNPMVDTTGGVVHPGAQVGERPDRDLRGQHYDEFTAGYERRLGRTYRVAIRGTYRTLRWVLEDAAMHVDSPLTVGNPGRGALSYLPRARREYAALELTVERSGGPLMLLASYVLSRNRGNYGGLYVADLSASSGANCGPQFDYPYQLVNATGMLPNDRTRVVKLVASYRFGAGVTLGTSTYVASGVPLSEYGTGVPYAWTFIRQRGTAGRTPATWSTDVRLSYDVPLREGSRLRPRVLLDVFNLGNQRRALTYDQRHYTTPDATGAPNPNYREVTKYQAPLSARLGVVVGF